MAPIPIRPYMTPGPHTIGPAASLSEAFDFMTENNIRHLPVVKEGALVGIVSQRDLYFLEGFKSVDVDTARVEEAMTANPYTVSPDASLHEVATQMAEHKYGAAVVTEGGKIAGVFTTTDALRALVSIASRPVAQPAASPARARRKAARPPRKRKR